MAAKFPPKVKNVFTTASMIDKKAVEVLESDLEWQKQFQLEVKAEFTKLEELRFKDIDWRLLNRENFRRFLMILLVAQNIAVFSLVTWALYADKMPGLQMVFSTLIGATLAETAATILIIVKWLYSEIPYEKKS